MTRERNRTHVTGRVGVNYGGAAKVRLACFACSALIVAAIAGCQEEPAKTLGLSLDPCIAKVKVTVRPGAPESQEVTLTNGAGTATFRTLDFNNDVEVRVEILALNPCEQNRFATGDYLSFKKGRLPANRSLSMTELNNRYRPQPVEGGGAVAAGECPTSRGPGLCLFVTDRATCRTTCWQQWARVRWFFVGTPDTELAVGETFPDSSGRSQKFGEFGRDLPEGSDGNCFREDDIPGLPAGIKGIVDAPNYPDDPNMFGQTLTAAIRAGVNPRPRPPFSIRYEFDLRSIHWCREPGPRILGFYTWGARQTFDFTPNPDPNATPIIITKRNPSAVDKNATWKNGSDGLDANMKNF